MLSYILARLHDRQAGHETHSEDFAYPSGAVLTVYYCHNPACGWSRRGFHKEFFG